MESCATCRFWKAHPEHEANPSYDGWCRRYPPTIVLADGVRTYWGEFPQIASSAWCGEYKPADEGGAT